MFFFNRYFGVIGHVPVFIQLFARPGSTLYSFCKPVRLYHQILAIIMQAIIACLSLQTYRPFMEAQLTVEYRYLHYEDLCLVQQEPRSSCWISISGPCLRRNRRCE